jgi:3-isopropylmalate dehydratase/3-isopropylmalate/(R)-2-methylmalate dehydratase small subunit
MKAFTTLTAVGAPMPIANVDTDQIIPKQFLKGVERTGLGRGLMYDFRFDEQGRVKPDFVLNQPAYKGAGVLIVGENFGCGSSREHAPWALLDFGISCVIAPSFADIFYGNCFNNGVLPITLSKDEVAQLTDEARGANHVFSVDLKAQTVTSPTGKVFTFELDPGRKTKLLEGLDDIGLSLKRREAIDAFEERRRLGQPWMRA